MSDRFWLSDAQMAGLAAEHGEEQTVMFGATYLLFGKAQGLEARRDPF
ncbi:hypothetical protein N0B44_13480 [Roseibacterium beibuensis]|uniref:Uncharacterized protein n=1 Tax=[Roseibacterium] beibuensis TaxID=1193142 RepID=A0ABP9LAN6_9RHOB|nr:hypothetical protein [Roseibacterium beibuensis]MCS6623923.1 hypothetical protein [Roseibacterium beibuensis]